MIAVAASGPESAQLAADLGDGLFATEPDGDLLSTWQRLGGSGPDGFMDFFARELAGPLRKLTPA